MTERSNPMWTPERDALLAELVANGTLKEACIAPIAALPGDPVTSTRQIGRRMYALKLKLPREAYREVYVRNMAGKPIKGTEPKMTPERLAYLEQACAEYATYEEMLVGVNALPGPKVCSAAALVYHIRRGGCRRQRPKVQHDAAVLQARRDRAAALRRAKRAAARGEPEAEKPKAPPMARRARQVPVAIAVPEPEPIAPPEPSPEIADASIAIRQARVKAQLRKDRSNAAALAAVHRLPLREVYRLAMEARREMSA